MVCLKQQKFFHSMRSTESDLDNPVKDHITPYSNVLIINLPMPLSLTQRLQLQNTGFAGLKSDARSTEVPQTVTQLCRKAYNKHWQKLTCSYHWEELICTWTDGTKEGLFGLCKGYQCHWSWYYTMVETYLKIFSFSKAYLSWAYPYSVSVNCLTACSCSLFQSWNVREQLLILLI